MHRYLLNGMLFMVLLDKAGEGAAGGDSGGDSGDKNKGAGVDPKEFEALKVANAAMLAELAKLKEAKPPEGDLADKARKEREEKDKKNGETKTLEKAIAFTMGSKDWLKTNESLLPKSIPGIFDLAEKENYGSASEKAAAIKVGIVSEFFAQQSNLDLLTETQKTALEDFRKLTKNDKADRVQTVYDSIFEPTFEMLKRVKKAEQLTKGLGDPSDAESAYRKKMQAISKKHYLKEKGI